MLVALVFIGVPFIVRTVQPVLEDLDVEFEEAAASLGATRLQTIRRVVLPALAPALLTGFALAFARAVGEYGSVIFIAGNLPMVSEITPLIIITKLEQYDYAGATAVAAVMLIVSFILLLIINALQAWTARSSERPTLMAVDRALACRAVRPRRRASRRSPAASDPPLREVDHHRHLADVLRDLSAAAAGRGVRRSLQEGLGSLSGAPSSSPTRCRPCG